jgi:hypothetical protein
MILKEFFKACETLNWHYDQLQNKKEYDDAFSQYEKIKEISKRNSLYSKIFSDWKAHMYSPLNPIKPRLEDYD